MASVKVNNVYYKTDIHYNEKIQDLFDHLSEGDRDGESASFRDLLDEHLQHFMDSCDSNQYNTDDTIEEEMDYYDGVYDIYFKRGCMHVSCKQSFANVVVKGLQAVLEYLGSNLTETEFAEFCNIKRIGPWT